MIRLTLPICNNYCLSLPFWSGSTTLVYSVFWVFLTTVLMACGAQVKPSAHADSSEQQHHVAASEPKAQTRQTAAMETVFLRRADALFREGKLLSPSDDNAYIRYRALQMLAPQSEEAKSGLDAILVNEISSARSLLSQGRLTQAGAQLKQLDEVFPDSPMLAQFADELKQARAQLRDRRERLQKEQERQSAKNIEWLDKRILDERGEAIKARLAIVANKLKTTNESIYIYARSDAEGRWIYKALKESVPGYLIRGDIRIGRPGIEFLPPLD